jgi:hypothetical protein
MLEWPKNAFFKNKILNFAAKSGILSQKTTFAIPTEVVS